MCKYVVFDLEMCNVPYSVRKGTGFIPMETIQIGAVLVDENLEIVDEFSTYVSPEKGWIDSKIHRLTGISNEDISGAPAFKEAIASFINWIPKDAKMVSWSDSDEIQIRSELEKKHIEITRLDEIFEGAIDCQLIFGERIHAERSYGLKDALCVADIIYEDGLHNGLVDAYNTALLFVKMEREPELKLNPYYKGILMDGEEEDNRCSSTLGSLFSNLDLSGIAVA